MWFTLFRILHWITGRYNLGSSIQFHVHSLYWAYWPRIFRGVEKEFENTALKAPSEIDGRALMWTYESLDEDHELEQFFAGIPGFCSSGVVGNPQSSFDSLRSRTAALALNRFLDRTWSSNLLSETITAGMSLFSVVNLSGKPHKMTCYSDLSEKPSII